MCRAIDIETMHVLKYSNELFHHYLLLLLFFRSVNEKIRSQKTANTKISFNSSNISALSYIHRISLIARVVYVTMVNPIVNLQCVAKASIA